MLYNYKYLFEEIVRAGLADQVGGGEVPSPPHIKSNLQGLYLFVHCYFADPERVAGLSTRLREIIKQIDPIDDPECVAGLSTRLREIAKQIGSIARNLKAFECYTGLMIVLHVSVKNVYIKIYSCNFYGNNPEEMVGEYCSL